jgi:hypothetical protein
LEKTSSAATLASRYVHKNLVRTIEDVGVNVVGVGTQYYIPNPGEGITLSLNDSSVPAFPKEARLRRARAAVRLQQLGALGQLYPEPPVWQLSGLANSDENGRTAPNVNRFFDAIERLRPRPLRKPRSITRTARSKQYGHLLPRSTQTYLASGPD